MKKGFMIALSVVAMMGLSCKGGDSKKTTQEQKDVTQTVTGTLDSLAMGSADGTHNAANSLDVAGTYKGTLPTASGEGMERVIVLTDSTYKLTNTYIGKKNGKAEEAGKYSWNKEANTITLAGTEAPNQYFVGENMLIQLDINGKRIEGALAEKYILRK